MDSSAIIELQRWGFPGVTKCRHRSIEFLTMQADQSKRDILIDYVLKKFFYLISIVMDSEILDQLTNLEKMLILK